MTNKQKAEQLVREKFPELMELSFGCQISPTSKKNGSKEIYVGQDADDEDLALVVLRSGDCPVNGEDAYNEIFTYHISDIEKDKIIGHPIQLHHWLRLLAGTNLIWELSDWGDETISALIYTSSEDEHGMHIMFNLKTGQPDTEEDYQKILEICV